MWQIRQQRLRDVAWFSCYASCSFVLNHCFSSELFVSPERWKRLSQLTCVRTAGFYKALSTFFRRTSGLGAVRVKSELQMAGRKGASA